MLDYEGRSAVDRLIALAGATSVEGHTRKTKSGKIVQVEQHMRAVADMPNMDLYREYKSFAKGDRAGDPQAANRQQQVINEIRKRQNTGKWGHSDAGAATRAAQRVDSTTGKPQQRAHSSRKEFDANLEKAASEEQPPKEMSEREYEEHVKRVREILNDPATAKLETQRKHGIWGWQEKDGKREYKPVPGLYSPERTEQHRKIIQDILDRHQNVPKEKQAVMSGGLGGAGKGFVLKKFADIDKSQYITIDPDEMKQELLNRGMVDEVEGLLPMEHAANIHEESSDLANLLHQVAMSQGFNIILDTTMASVKSTEGKVKKFQKEKYDIEAVFVDVPVEVSIDSALKRHRGGVDRFRMGVEEDHGDLGGRFVPPEYLQGARAEPGSPYQSKNRGAFEELKKQGLFKRSRVYDNSVRTEGAVPRLVSDEVHGGGSKSDPSKTSQEAVEKLKKKTQKDEKVIAASAVERLRMLTLVNSSR